MRILVVLTYYRPHTSGLTIYAERLAKALVRKGHQVTVLTSQYDKTLALEEECEGVKVVRVPVSFRISKGVIMPKFGLTATRLVNQHDVIQLHLPQFDAAGVALRGRLSKKTDGYHLPLRPASPAWGHQLGSQPGSQADEHPGSNFHPPDRYLYSGLRKKFQLSAAVYGQAANHTAAGRAACCNS